MNKLMYQFVATTKEEIDPFLDTVCPLRASRVIIQNLNEKEQSAAELSDGASLRNLDHRNSFRPHFTAVKSTFSLKKI